MKFVFSKKIILIFLSTLATSLDLLSKKVLPEFANEWYDRTEDIKRDSCWIPHFQYHLKASNKDVIVEDFIAHLPQHKDCQWLNRGPVTAPMVPDDFPISPTGYYEILRAHPDSPQVAYWMFFCLDNNNHEIDQATLLTQPTYRCPKATAIKNSEYGSFCSTEPGVCMADVVGRDFNIPNFGWVGHIGLIKSNLTDEAAFVLEVLNERPVIQLNPLTTFKTISRYWGAVYGLEEEQIIEADKATSAFQAGVNQIQFNPEYTPTAQWIEGRYIPRPVYDESQNQLVQKEYH